MLRIEQHTSDRYPPRTWINATSADLTVAIAVDYSTKGELLTHRAAGEAYLALPLEWEPLDAARELWRAMQARDARSLNVAGNGISTMAKHGWSQEAINAWVFQVIGKVHEHRPIQFIRSGGQTGADIAGLVAAYALGIDCLGLFPKRYLQRSSENVDIRRSKEEIEAEIKAWAAALT